MEKWRIWAEIDSSAGNRQRGRKGEGLYAEMRGGVSEAVRIVGVPTRRDADIAQTEQAFDRRPLADIVALGEMADPLQQVADNESANAPIPGKEEQHHDAADG